MLISELKQRVINTQVKRQMGYIFPDEDSKEEAISEIEIASSLLGEHKIPSSLEEYASIMIDAGASNEKEIDSGLAKTASSRMDADITPQNREELIENEVEYRTYLASRIIYLVG